MVQLSRVDCADVRCQHRTTVSVYGIFRFMRRCALCESKIWDILNVVQCSDCDCVMHGSCSLNNTLYHAKEILMLAGSTNSRDLTLVDAISIFKSNAIRPEKRRAMERDLRARKAMERAAETRLGDEAQVRSSQRDADVPTWQNRPTPPVDYGGKWVRETFCNGRRPAAAVTTDRGADRRTGHRVYRRMDHSTYHRTNHHANNRFHGGFQNNTRNQAWKPQAPTHVFTPKASPPPPTPYSGQLWYGPHMSGPFTGPPMWHPYFAPPTFIVMPESNACPTSAKVSSANDSVPTVEDNAPNLKEETMIVKDNASKTNDVDPTVEDKAPKVNEASPTTKNDDSKLKDKTSIVKDNATKVKDDCLKEKDATLTPKNDTSEMKGKISTDLPSYSDK